MDNTMIADRPPNDGREWDAQCARCGSSCAFSACPTCGGDGFTEDDDALYGDNRPVHCGDCRGAGGFVDCGSDAAYCEAHPSKGREGIERGAVEWFVVPGDRCTVAVP